MVSCTVNTPQASDLLSLKHKVNHVSAPTDQTSGVAPHRTFTVEYYTTDFDDHSVYYHFAMIFHEDHIGFMRVEFYQLGPNSGPSVIGNLGQNIGHYPSDPALPPNSWISFDTDTGVIATGSL